MTRHLAAGLALLCLSTTSVRAHDYWLEPESFFPEAGKPMAVRLQLGDHFASDGERPFQRKQTSVFQMIGAKKTFDLKEPGAEGKTPVAWVTAPTPGTYLLRMDRAAQLIKLDAEKFNKYLAEEGLGSVLEMRRRAGEDKKEGRERYSRCLKAIFQAGPTRDDTWKRVLGQTLEIVPQANPYELKPGAALSVRILLDGKPLGGAKVFAHCRTTEKVLTQTAISSKDGLATIQLERPGDWLLRLVHMRRHSGSEEADWESFWAALTFGLK